MSRTAILNVVGLTARHISAETTPQIFAWLKHKQIAPIRPVLPAVTTTMQATYLTGRRVSDHGIVANGWYNREMAEVQMWKQSNHLVKGEKFWDVLKREYPGYTVAKLFWWYNMYSTADYSITPRPAYPADGRKVFDIYTQPGPLREAIKADLGDFPFPSFWGPLAGIACSQWIADSAKWTEDKYWPNLSLVYLPHLDYNLQRLGPEDPAVVEDLLAIDAIVGDLIQFYKQRAIRVVHEPKPRNDGHLCEQRQDPKRTQLGHLRLGREGGVIRRAGERTGGGLHASEAIRHAARRGTALASCRHRHHSLRTCSRKLPANPSHRRSISMRHHAGTSTAM